MQPRTSLSLRRAPCLLAEYGKAHWYNPFSARSNDQRYDRGVLINQSPGLSNDDVEPCFFWVVFSKSTAAPQSTEHMVLFHRWRWPWWPPPNALRNKWPKCSKPARFSSQKKPTLPGYCVELVLAARPRWYSVAQALCQSSSKLWKTTVFQGALMFSRIVFMRSVFLHWIYVEVSALPQLAPKQRKCRANNTWWVPSLWNSAWVGSDMDFKFQHQLGLQLDTNLLAYTFYLRSFTSCNTKAIPVATGCKCMWKWFCGNEKSLELAMAAWEFARYFVPRPWTSAA